jgi:hypothetical protein
MILCSVEIYRYHPKKLTAHLKKKLLKKQKYSSKTFVGTLEITDTAAVRADRDKKKQLQKIKTKNISHPTVFYIIPVCDKPEGLSHLSNQSWTMNGALVHRTEIKFIIYRQFLNLGFG